MSLLGVILALVVVGLILYLVNRFIPLDPKIKTILNWVVIIFLIIWLLRALGAFDYLSGIRL